MKRLLVLSFLILSLILTFQHKSELHSESQVAKQSSVNQAGSRSGRHKSAERLEPVQANELQAASGSALKLIQQSQVVWSQKESCTSCHHQLLPEIPIRLARERGVPVDENIARATTANAFAYLKDLDSAQQGYDS